jgi:hypothetical protein
MIPVIMDPCMKNTANWEGIMGLTLGTMLYVDMTSDDAPIFEEKCDELFHRIQSLSHEKNSLSSVAKLPAPPTVDRKQEAPSRQDPPTVDLETKDETAEVSPGTALNKAKEVVNTKGLWMQAPLRKVALDETPLSSGGGVNMANGKDGSPTWTCSVCKKINTLDSLNCTRCFIGRAYCYQAPSNLQKKNVCKICHGPTEKRFFCVKCVEQHKRKTGKKFSGYSTNCLNCSEMTLNDDYCEDCLVNKKSSRDGKAFERREKISLSSVTTSPVVAPAVDIKQKVGLREDPPPVILQAKDETPAVSSGAALKKAKAKDHSLSWTCSKCMNINSWDTFFCTRCFGSQAASNLQKKKK